MKDIKVKLSFFIFCNAVFLLYFLHSILPYPAILFTLFCNLMIFIIPGLPWVLCVPRVRDDIVGFLFYAILFSTLILIVGIGLFCLAAIAVSPVSFLIYLCVVTNLGLVFYLLSGAEFCAVCDKGSGLWIAVIFLIVYATVYNYAVYRVPAEEDSDIELQGTSYGMIHAGKPMMLTDRGTVYYFAHPLLIHLYSAYTILFTDSLNNMKYYFDFGAEGKKLMEEPLTVGEQVAFSMPDGESIVRTIIGIEKDMVRFDQPLNYIEAGSNSFVSAGDIVSRDLVKRQKLWPLVTEEYARFKRSSELQATRMPHIFISAMSAVVLMLLLLQLTGSRFLSVSGPLLYFSFPVMLSLTASELYTSISHFALLLCAYFYVKRPRAESAQWCQPALLFFAGMFAALVSHKTVIFPLAVMVRQLLLKNGGRTWKSTIGGIFSQGVVPGFIFGTAVFWAYGLGVDANIFITDHIKYHIWDRIFHVSDFGYQGYPSVVQLWGGFINSLGGVFILLSAVSCAALLRGAFDEQDDKVIFSLWCLVGAVVFSIVDWREMLHLSLIFPAMLVMVFVFASRQDFKIKWVCFIGLFYCFLTNLWQVVR